MKIFVARVEGGTMISGQRAELLDEGGFTGTGHALQQYWLPLTHCQCESPNILAGCGRIYKTRRIRGAVRSVVDERERKKKKWRTPLKL
jgi:hypothetical protein